MRIYETNEFKYKNAIEIVKCPNMGEEILSQF